MCKCINNHNDYNYLPTRSHKWLERPLIDGIFPIKASTPLSVVMPGCSQPDRQILYYYIVKTFDLWGPHPLGEMYHVYSWSGTDKTLCQILQLCIQ